MGILIKNGHVIDPANNVDDKLNILIEGGKISKASKNITANGHDVIEASGKFVIPGLVDMHAHFRQPGREDEETIESGSRAAAAGGYTSVCCMPNTSPVIDNEGGVEFIYNEARRAGIINVYPIAAITKDLGGKELSEIMALKASGAVAISDDGKWVSDSNIMRRALEYAQMAGLIVISHCEDKTLSEGGVMNEGLVSTLLGLRGMPNASEAVAIARDIELARLTLGRLHIAHVSTAASVELIRRAKAEGVKITAEAAPHHFSLTDEACKGYNTNTKVNPPLRAKDDVEAIKAALADGTIDAIATDHAPHSESEKDVEFDYAPFGMIGLETAFSLGLSELVDKKILTLSQLVEKMSGAPADILGLNKGALSAGADADIAIIDLARERNFTKESIISKSHNSPFIGRRLKGITSALIVGGNIIIRDEKFVK